MSTNVPQPYKISLSQLEPNNPMLAQLSILGSQAIDNTLVIDTQSRPDEIYSYQTFALLGSQTLTILDENGTAQIIPLHDIEDSTINQEFVKQTALSIATLLQGITVILYP